MSSNLKKSFEEYRKTQEYIDTLPEKIKSLKAIWVSTEFAEKLAIVSINNWIEISELLKVKEQIIAEDIMIERKITNNKINNVIDITSRLPQNRKYQIIAEDIIIEEEITNNNVIDITNRLPQDRKYQWIWLRNAS